MKWKLITAIISSLKSSFTNTMVLIEAWYMLKCPSKLFKLLLSPANILKCFFTASWPASFRVFIHIQTLNHMFYRSLYWLWFGWVRKRFLRCECYWMNEDVLDFLVSYNFAVILIKNLFLIFEVFWFSRKISKCWTWLDFNSMTI